MSALRLKTSFTFPTIPPSWLIDTHLFFIGLLHMWVKDMTGDQFRDQAIELVRAHMRIRRKERSL